MNKCMYYCRNKDTSMTLTEIKRERRQLAKKLHKEFSSNPYMDATKLIVQKYGTDWKTKFKTQTHGV